MVQVLFCKYDPDTNVVWMAGKGDGNIRYFEIDGGDMFYLSEYKSSNPQRGVGWLPKLAINVNKCEVGRAYKLHPKGFVEVISFTVPRKSTLFQDDLYPPTKEPVAVMSAEEWLAGKAAKPNKVSMADFFVAEARSAATGGLNGPGGGGGLNAAKKGGLNAPKKPTVGLNKKPAGEKPAPVTAKPTPVAAAAPAAVHHAPAAAHAPSGGGDKVAELEAVVAKKDAEIKELKKHLATLEIKLREYESQ
jgi:coronin-1B/1C/6